MKTMKKLVSLSVGIIMTTTLFSGCSIEGNNLRTALNKNGNVKSVESKTDISFKVGATGLSVKDEQVAQMVFSNINNSKVSMNSKMTQNAEKTVGKAQSDLSLQLGGMPMTMNVWVDSDLSANQTKIKEVIKMPELLTMQMPKEFANKPYMVLDMGNTDKKNLLNYNKLTQFTKDFQGKYLEFMKNYALQFNPNFKVVSRVGYSTENTPTGVKKQEKYQIKLDDETFKQLLKYTATNFISNKEAMDFLKDYFSAVMEVSSSTAPESKDMQIAMEKSFNDFQNNLPKAQEEINKFFDTMKNVRIIGQKGIVINYTVNDDGYVTNQQGTIDLMLDLASISKINGQNDQNTTLSGIYTFCIDFNTEYYNFNKDLEIKFPTLTPDNSVDYMELMKMSQQPLHQ